MAQYVSGWLSTTIVGGNNRLFWCGKQQESRTVRTESLAFEWVRIQPARDSYIGREAPQWAVVVSIININNSAPLTLAYSKEKEQEIRQRCSSMFSIGLVGLFSKKEEETQARLLQ